MPIVLWRELYPFDMAGWRKRVEDLRAASDEDLNAEYLEYAEAHLAAIERAALAETKEVAETAPERRSGAGWDFPRRKAD